MKKTQEAEAEEESEEKEDGDDDEDDDDEDDDDDDDDDDDEEEEDEEDPVDPMDTLRESCAANMTCRNLMAEFEKCTERVEGKERTRETCSQEILDFMHCRDECMSKSLFPHLK